MLAADLCDYADINQSYYMVSELGWTNSNRYPFKETSRKTHENGSNV